MARLKHMGRLPRADSAGRPATGLPAAAGETWREFLRDFWGFMRVRKKYWLLPLVVPLILFGVMIVCSSGSAVAPFIYTLF